MNKRSDKAAEGEYRQLSGIATISAHQRQIGYRYESQSRAPYLLQSEFHFLLASAVMSCQHSIRMHDAGI